MNFISLPFAIFIVILLILLWIFKKPLFRKGILLAGSCVFYAWWDLRFLVLLWVVILFNFFFSRLLVKDENSKKNKKVLLWVGILIDLLILAYFKYNDFFLGAFADLLADPAARLDALAFLFPIGISFYIFQTISYLVDVFKGTVKPETSLLDYAIFITFFPRLLAGPIMRVREFFPQLQQGIQLNLQDLYEGAQLFLLGMLKKLVIADNLAVLVDQVYGSPTAYASPTVWLAVASYSVQILFDFWGYTDMALGIGRILGFNLPKNFDLPYTAQSITEFWSRWHISLSNWFRDYVFFPLRNTMLRRDPKPPEWFTLIVPSMVTMLLSGVWHGAAWNFILWGGLHGLFNIQEHLPGVKPARYSWRSYKAWATAFLVFLLITLLWIPFRSADWQTTLDVFQRLLFLGEASGENVLSLPALIMVPAVLVGGFLARRFKWSWPIFKERKFIALGWVVLEVLVIVFFANFASPDFIYFQF